MTGRIAQSNKQLSAEQMSIQEKNSSEKKEHAAGGKQEHSSVSQLLRQLRKEKGLSLQDIAGETNISVSNLVSIENEAYEDLPADTFIRGQIAIYGNLLGIDGPDVARQFLAERHKHQQKMGRPGLSGRDQGSMSANKLSEPSYLSSATVAAFLLALILLTVAAFSLFTGWNPFAYLTRHESPPTVPLPASSSLPPIVAPPDSTAEETPPAEPEEQTQTALSENSSSAADAESAAAAATEAAESSQQQ
jgi:cytoskeletal protein RodZ